MTAAEQASSQQRSFGIPRESEELRTTLHSVIGGEPERAQSLIVERLSAYFLRGWSEQLDARKMPPNALGDILDEYYREIYLWIMKDRTWGQLVEAIAGRIDRRFPQSR